VTDHDRPKTAGWEQPPHPGERRWWAAAAAVAAVVLGIAVLVLPRDRTAGLSVGPTTAPVEATLTDPVDPRDFIPERLAPVDTTTEQPGTGQLLPGAPADLTIIAADDSGLYLLETDTGDLRRIAVRRPAPASLSETLFVVGDHIVVDADTDVVVLPRTSVRPTRIADGHRAVPTVDDRSVWVFDSISPFVTGTASRIGLDGTVHTQVQLPAIAEPLVGTADGLVVGTPGAVTLVGADGQRRLVARGMAVATDGRRLAWLQCADDLSCAVNIGTIDDPEQVRTALDPRVLPAGFFGLPTGTFSPDGRWLALPLYESGRGLEDVTVSVIDTTTGTEAYRAQGSTRTPFNTPLAWSPDSRWLIFVSESELRAWPAGQRQATTIDMDLGGIRALAVR
jgi:hypothetical protein